MSTRQLVILGAGGLAREVFSYLSVSEKTWDYPEVAFLDDTNAHSRVFFGGSGQERLFFINGLSDEDQRWRGSDFLIAVGSPGAKRALESRYGQLLGEAISVQFGCHHVGQLFGRDYLSPRGLIVTPGCVLTTNITLGKHVVVNINSTVGHDTRIGDYTTVNPGCNISGEVVIGEGCLIGTGAVIREKVHIAPGVTVGMGAVVTKNLDVPGGVYVGNPARLVTP